MRSRVTLCVNGPLRVCRRVNGGISGARSGRSQPKSCPLGGKFFFYAFRRELVSSSRRNNTTKTRPLRGKNVLRKTLGENAREKRPNPKGKPLRLYLSMGSFIDVFYEGC